MTKANPINKQANRLRHLPNQLEVMLILHTQATVGEANDSRKMPTSESEMELADQ